MYWFSLAQKKSSEWWSIFHGLKVYQVLIRTLGCRCSMETVLCHNALSTNGLRSSKMVAQMLRMRKELDQRLKEVLYVWLVFQPKTSYSEGRKKTVWQWTKSIKKQGDYIEKWCKISTLVANVKHTLKIVTDSALYITDRKKRNC